MCNNYVWLSLEAYDISMIYVKHKNIKCEMDDEIREIIIIMNMYNIITNIT